MGCGYSAIWKICLVLTVLSSANRPLVAAKTDPGRDQAFLTIITSYENANWGETLVLIDQFRGKFPLSDREASLMMISAECNVKLRNLERAEAEAAQVLLQFPELNFAGRARVTLGECALLRGDWSTAELNLAWVVSFSDDVNAVSVAKRRLEELEAFRKATEALASPPDTGSAPKVALILPVTGLLASQGDHFQAGFRFAWKQTGYPEPLLFDSESDPVKSVRIFKEISQEYQPWVVVGGLSINEATGLAAYSRYAQIPFITTTCGDDGLASISPFTIQGRADYGGMAGELGKFATINRGLKNLAIFYVNTIVGSSMAQEFREQATRYGGNVRAEIPFFPGTIDFSKNLLQLKYAYIRSEFDDSLDAEYQREGQLVLNEVFYVPGGKDLLPPGNTQTSLNQAEKSRRLSKSFLDSLWTSSLKTRRWTAESSHDFDSASIELPDLEGIFVVIEPGMIEMIAPQLTRYRLNRQIFGNEHWDDRESLRKVQRYVDGIVFSNPLSPGHDSTLKDISIAIDAQGDKSLTPYHLAGERAARIVEAALAQNPGKDRMREALTTLNGVETLTGKVTFVKEERVDRSQSLILYKDGEFIKINE